MFIIQKNCFVLICLNSLFVIDPPVHAMMIRSRVGK
jgi:hypothetical protein